VLPRHHRCGLALQLEGHEEPSPISLDREELDTVVVEELDDRTEE
jgi:hypothetical protein